MLTRFGLLSGPDIVVAIIDVLIVAFCIYRVYLLIRGTKAVQLVKGIAVLLLLTVLSYRLELITVHWLLDKALVMLLVALPVVFQPELRRALEQLGRGRLFYQQSATPLTATEVSNCLVSATGQLSAHKRGALIVVERKTGVGDFAETGIRLDARLTAELLVNLFLVDGPLHDGATIIRGDRVLSAGCFLPLTEQLTPASTLGGRHRAAMGITEQTDAIAVVVSEETGDVSVAIDGQFSFDLMPAELRSVLQESINGRGTAL